MWQTNDRRIHYFEDLNYVVIHSITFLYGKYRFIMYLPADTDSPHQINGSTVRGELHDMDKEEEQYLQYKEEEDAFIQSVECQTSELSLEETIYNWSETRMRGGSIDETIYGTMGEFGEIFQELGLPPLMDFPFPNPTITEQPNVRSNSYEYYKKKGYKIYLPPPPLPDRALKDIITQILNDCCSADLRQFKNAASAAEDDA